MSKSLSLDFIDKAFRTQSVWNLGNEVLYRLCEAHPAHKTSSEVVAKIWLIGRAYAAAIERRRDKPENKGDEFYEKDVIPKIIDSDIDMWIGKVPHDSDPCGRLALQVHKRLTDLFYEITQMDKRSLASKYLHFHKRNAFLIYDSRADEASRKIARALSIRRRSLGPEMEDGDVDRVYATFAWRCQLIREHLG